VLPLRVGITPDGGIDVNGNSDVDKAILVTNALVLDHIRLALALVARTMTR
jgi:hypothetical protein